MHTLEQYFNVDGFFSCVFVASRYDEASQQIDHTARREKSTVKFTTEMSLFVCYVPTVNMLCQSSTCTFGNKNAVRRPPVFFLFWRLVYFFFSLSLKTRLFTSLQFTKCELRNVISISVVFSSRPREQTRENPSAYCTIALGKRMLFISYFFFSIFNFNVKNIMKSYCSTSHIFI